MRPLIKKEIALSVPGKTFLAGEYLALKGGPVFVLGTQPKFEVIIRPYQDGMKRTASTFHPLSPAGKLYFEELEYFSQFDFTWKNPYGSGGFGASTAEFIALQTLVTMKESLWVEQERHFDLKETLKAYKDRTTTMSQKWNPSGADLVGQICGGVTFFENSTGRLQILSWPFLNLGFSIIKTDVKLATHEHLNELKDFEASRMTQAVEQLHESISTVAEDLFVSSIRDFASELKRQALVAPTTLELLQKLNSPEVLASKGCGALGADVILLVHGKADHEKIQQKVKALGLSVVATENDLTHGLRVNLHTQLDSSAEVEV